MSAAISTEISADSRSICRPSLGWYLGWYIGQYVNRHISVNISTDTRPIMSIDISADTRPMCRPIDRSSVDRDVDRYIGRGVHKYTWSENSIIASDKVTTILHLHRQCVPWPDVMLYSTLNIPLKVNRNKIPDYKIFCFARKTKYSLTLDNFSLSTQQLVLSFILYPCKCPDVYLHGAQFWPNKHFSQTAIFCQNS